jgi:hypothetical protein
MGAALGQSEDGEGSVSEEWRSLPDYLVEVSSLGRVRSLTRIVQVKASHYRPAYEKVVVGQVLKPWSTHGYATVKTAKGKFGVHQLVCLAWHGAPPPGKNHALHSNGDKSVNAPWNLYWGDHQDNMQDAVKHGVMGAPPVLTEEQAREIKARRAAGERGYVLAEEFGISQQAVCDLHKGRAWKHL